MAACPFGLCDGSGFVVDEVTNSAAPCRCRAQLISRRKARSLSAVIPRKYKDVGFDRNPVAQMPEPVVRQIRAYIRTLDANLAEGHSVAIYSMPRLLNEIRRTYDEGSDSSYIQLLDRLAEVDLLHIDDVGAEKSSAWVLEQLYAIVNARYEAQRSMTITTNLSHEELGEQIGARTVSRLVEMCAQLPLLGSDHRPVLEHSA